MICSPKQFYEPGHKRYQTYDSYLKRRFGGKAARVSLDAGFTCPNIDGTKGTGGCVYCSPKGSGDFAASPDVPIPVQLEQGMEQMKQKWPDIVGYIPYFQAHTNTYAPVTVLRELYETALNTPGVIGLSIATRPDCLPEPVCDLLEELSKRTYLTVELGLQSIHDETGCSINRCHTTKDFLTGYERLAKRGILVGVHLINGLPGESREQMVESAARVGRLHPHLVKLHLLYVSQGTVLARWYQQGLIRTMTREAYVETVCDQLEALPPDVVLGRLTGDGDPAALIAPEWSRKKLCVLNEIDKEMKRRDAFQGDRG